MKRIYVLLAALLLLYPYGLSVQAQSMYSYGPRCRDNCRQNEQSLQEAIQRQLQGQQRQSAHRITAPGLENAYRVSPLLYRGAQPTEEGYRSLKAMGVKAVVNLRVSPPNKQFIESLGIRSYHIPINPLLFRTQHAKQFLQIIQDTSDGPVFVHCKYGSDRTGTMVALYRMVFEHWTREAALREMQNERFGFHPVFANLVEFVKTAPLYDITPQEILGNTVLEMI